MTFLLSLYWRYCGAENESSTQEYSLQRIHLSHYVGTYMLRRYGPTGEMVTVNSDRGLNKMPDFLKPLGRP